MLKTLKLLAMAFALALGLYLIVGIAAKLGALWLLTPRPQKVNA